MDRKEISRRASEKGLILSSAALERMADEGLDCEAVFRRAKEAGEWFVKPELVDLEARSKTPVCEAAVGSEGVPGRPPACDMASRLVIYEDSDVSGKSTCSGTIEDFIGYFNARYDNLRRVLLERMEYRSAMNIESLRKAGSKEKARMIAMVREKREGKNKGNRFLEVEDQTGELTVLLSDKSENLGGVWERILPDEVLGFEGILRGDLFIASEINQPDVPLNHARRYADEDVYAVFLSDIHVGSYLFLEREFQSFIEWLNGRGGRQDIAWRVKYVFVAGDLVDGIGIYPDQEKELTMPDIVKQYEFLGMLLSEIPPHIEVVLSMGNHDAARNAEPQPKVARDLAPRLYEMPNVHVVGNPVRLSAHGVEFLMYHGTSLDTIIGGISGCSYARPETAMIELLRRRHLAPTYGSDNLSPENKDYMFIGDVPDVFHCGHVHTNGYTLYRGVNVINSGTWQAKTAFQERLGHQPTPALVPVMNLQNHEVTMLDFNGDGRRD